jgi:hypothetical protein
MWNGLALFLPLLATLFAEAFGQSFRQLIPVSSACFRNCLIEIDF